MANNGVNKRIYKHNGTIHIKTIVMIERILLWKKKFYKLRGCISIRITFTALHLLGNWDVIWCRKVLNCTVDNYNM